MTRPKAISKANFAETPARASYDVGYGKPPQHSRFKPGQSGNPRGRPKGSKNKRPALNEERMKSIIYAEAYRNITLRDGDGQVSMPVAQAVIRSIAVNAAKNRIGAQRLFTELLASAEESDRAQHEALLQAAIEYKTSWEQELWRREQEGLIGPQPVPHPDDIVIDMQTGEVLFTGPRTPEEKAELQEWVGQRAGFELVRDRLKESRAHTKSRANRESLEESIKRIETTIEDMRYFDERYKTEK